MAHIATDSTGFIVEAAPTAAMITAWINAQATPADFTAVDTGAIDYPIGFAIGQWWWRSGAFHDTPSPTILLQKQAAARAMIDRFESYKAQLTREAGTFGTREVNYGHDFLAKLEHGAFRVFMSDQITDARKLGWAQQSANGPSNLDLSTEELRRTMFYRANVLTLMWNDTELAARTPREGIIVCSTVAPFDRYQLEDIVVNTELDTNQLAPHPAGAVLLESITNHTWPNDIT